MISHIRQNELQGQNESKIAGFFDDSHELFPVESAIVVLVRLGHHPNTFLLFLTQFFCHALQVCQSHHASPSLIVKLKGLPKLILLISKILHICDEITSLAVINLRKESLLIMPLLLSSRYSIIWATWRLSISQPSSFMFSINPLASIQPAFAQLYLSPDYRIAHRPREVLPASVRQCFRQPGRSWFELQQLTLLLICSMAHLSDRAHIIQVKQKLDQLRLPSSFAQEDLALISKLLSRLQECQEEAKKADQTQEHSKEYNQTEEALSQEVTRLVRENGSLRRQLWTARETVQELRMAISGKMQAKLQKQAKQLDQLKILQEKNRRQSQLLAELQQIRYKYNQIMQLAHQDPLFEREYIKRLLKFKKIQKIQLQSQPSSISKPFPAQTSNDSSKEVTLLKSKLAVREQQIHRLQLLVQENHNYIHNRYIQQKQLQRQMLLHEQISYLSKENEQMKKKLACIPHYHFKSPLKIEKSNSKQDLIVKKYSQQFQEAAQEQQSILQQRYASPKDKQREDRKMSDVKNNEEGKNMKLVKEHISQYYHNSSINQQNKQKEQKVKTSQPLYSPNPINKPQIGYQRASQQKNIHYSNRSQKKTTINSPNHANSSSYHTSLSNVKQNQHTSPSPALQQPKSKQSIHAKPPKSPKHKAASKDEQNLISAYERLLQQKNFRIAQLEEQLKSVGGRSGRSTKIISTQNINTNNSPSKNVIIKSNRSEYIHINNITPVPSERAEEKEFDVEGELAQAAKERERLNERVESLERERKKSRSRKSQQERQQDDAQLINEGKYLTQTQQLQLIKQKLAQSQNNLLSTNQKNLILQKRIKELLLQQRQTAQAQIRFNKEERVLNDQHWRTQITSLQTQNQGLQIEMSNLNRDKQMLLAKLRELQIALLKQTTQMRAFQRRLYEKDHSLNSSIVSEVKDLENQSEIDCRK